MTVADYIARFLVAKGVTHVFGFQGSAMLKLLDAMMSTGKIQYIQNFHEQASAFAADAFARVSGKVGVAIATSGPGASNLVTGIASAYYDSIPVLFITGQDRRAHVLATSRSRQNGFQDMDIVSMVSGITKRAVLAETPEMLADELERCWNVAQEGRKGPALIDVPIDLQFDIMPECPNAVTLKPQRRESTSNLDIAAALDCIASSARPVVLAGGGVRLAGAVAKLRAFVSATGLPVVSSLMGVDACDLSLGFCGIYGNPVPNRVLRESDLIIACGTRFAFHQTGRNLADYAPYAKVVHVDIDEGELGRVYKNAVMVKSDLCDFLDCALESMRRPDIGQWLARIETWVESSGKAPKAFPARFLDKLFSIMPDDAVVSADVGTNQMWVAQEFRANGRNRLLNSGGLGAMGYSLPAAIGASYSTQGPVVSVCGDGGFQMNVQELNTLALRRNNVKVFVFNNSSLGLMRGIQKKYYDARYTGNTPSEFTCPDIRQLAAAYGLDTMRVESDADFGRIASVFADSGPWLVDVVIDEDDIALSRYEREAQPNG